MKRSALARGTSQLKRSGFKHPTKRVKRLIVKSKPKKRVKTQAQLKKQLDTIFSLYIRKVHPAKCYTCGKTDTALQCGHFVSRSYLATRFHENNCRPQCIGCNIFGHGKPLDFEENLKRDLGEQYVEDMKKLRHLIVKYDRTWYQEKINYFELLLDNL